jgi:hypothetical protein
MGFLDRQIKKGHTIEDWTVSRSKALTVEEQMTKSLNDQLKIINGGTVLKSDNKPLLSWRKENGDVSIKIGVLSLLKEDGVPVVFQNIDIDAYKEIVMDIKSDFEGGLLKEEIKDLKKRKDVADRKAAATKEKNARIYLQAVKDHQARWSREPLRIEFDDYPYDNLTGILDNYHNQNIVEKYCEGGSELEVYIEGKLILKTRTINAMMKCTSLKTAFANIKNGMAIKKYTNKNDIEPWQGSKIFLPIGIMVIHGHAKLYDERFKKWKQGDMKVTPLPS